MTKNSFHEHILSTKISETSCCLMHKNIFHVHYVLDTFQYLHIHLEIAISQIWKTKNALKENYRGYFSSDTLRGNNISKVH